MAISIGIGQSIPYDLDEKDLERLAVWLDAYQDEQTEEVHGRAISLPDGVVIWLARAGYVPILIDCESSDGGLCVHDMLPDHPFECFNSRRCSSSGGRRRRRCAKSSRRAM